MVCYKTDALIYKSIWLFYIENKKEEIRLKQKIKFVKRFMSVVVVAVIVFATVACIGNFFPNIKSEAAARQTLYICDIKSGGFSANYAGYTRLSIDRNAGNVNRGCGKGSNDYI